MRNSIQKPFQLLKAKQLYKWGYHGWSLWGSYLMWTWTTSPPSASIKNWRLQAEWEHTGTLMTHRVLETFFFICCEKNLRVQVFFRFFSSLGRLKLLQCRSHGFVQHWPTWIGCSWKVAMLSFPFAIVPTCHFSSCLFPCFPNAFFFALVSVSLGWCSERWCEWVEFSVLVKNNPRSFVC